MVSLLCQLDGPGMTDHPVLVGMELMSRGSQCLPYICVATTVGAILSEVNRVRGICIISVSVLLLDRPGRRPRLSSPDLPAAVPRTSAMSSAVLFSDHLLMFPCSLCSFVNSIHPFIIDTKPAIAPGMS